MEILDMCLRTFSSNNIVKTDDLVQHLQISKVSRSQFKVFPENVFQFSRFHIKTFPSIDKLLI